MSKFKVGDKVKILDDVIPWGKESTGVIVKFNRHLNNFDVNIRVLNNGVTVATYMNQLYENDMELLQPETR